MTQTFKQDNPSSLKVVYLRVVSSLVFFFSFITATEIKVGYSLRGM